MVLATQIIFSKKLDIKKKCFLRLFQIFPDFFLRIGLDWRALVKSHIPNIEKQRGYFLAEKKYVLKISELKKESNF